MHVVWKGQNGQALEYNAMRQYCGNPENEKRVGINCVKPAFCVILLQNDCPGDVALVCIGLSLFNVLLQSFY